MKVTFEDTSRTIAVDGVELHYHTAGEGDAVVLLHGGGPGGHAWTNWELNIGALADDFEVFALDLPGFGRSGNPPRDDGPVFAFYAMWVQKFVQALGLERVHLVGNSLGGGTSVAVALQAPELVGRLALNGPAGGFSSFMPNTPPGIYMNYYDRPTKETLKTFLVHLVYDPATITEDMLEDRHQVSLRPEIMADPPMLNWMALAQKELALRLSEVTAPTLILWGRDDRGLGFDAGVFMLKQMPNADLVVASKAGHWVQRERPELFNRVVRDFLLADSIS